MDVLVALTEFPGEASPTLWIIAAVLLVVGGGSLFLDLVGRVLGTYVRTPARIVARVSLVALSCLLLTIPHVLAAGRVAPGATFWLVVSILLSLLATVSFLFPYRFGIRRVAVAASVRQEPLAPGIVLRPVAAQAPLPHGNCGSIHCLVLSDLHCNTRSKLKLLEDSFRILGERGCDLVFVLGDLGETEVLLPDLLRAIGGLKPRYGAFGVFGNHDCENGRAGLIADLAKDNAITLLANEARDVESLGVQIVGLVHPWRRRPLPSRSQAPFAIGLTHTPDNITLFHRIGVPLVLAGHTHGGKLGLPRMGRILVPSMYGRFLDEGWFELGRTRMYVTPGIGHPPEKPRKGGVILELTITGALVPPGE